MNILLFSFFCYFWYTNNSAANVLLCISVPGCEYISQEIPRSGIAGKGMWLLSFYIYISIAMGFPDSASSKKPSCQHRRHKRCGFDCWVGKIPRRRAWQPTPVFLRGESCGQSSLAGYTPYSHQESDTTEATYHACISCYIVLPKYVPI